MWLTTADEERPAPSPDPADCPPATSEPEYDNLILPAVVRASAIHAQVSFNGALSKETPTYVIGASCYASPVDIYLADWYEDGSLQFLDETGNLTTAPVPYRLSATDAIQENITIDAPSGVHAFYWIITPSNGGDFQAAIASGAYIIGWHDYEVK